MHSSWKGVFLGRHLATRQCTAHEKDILFWFVGVLCNECGVYKVAGFLLVGLPRL